jgi:stage IV sporulation protein B
MLGSASIYTTNLDDEVVEYEIKILEIDKESKDKNFYFEVVDKDLLEMSGGIVQGMSGSPIIQNDKIIGAVTRVLIDDVKKGYGISIVTMLEEGDKLAE